MKRPFSRGALYALLRNPIYIGKIRHKEKLHTGLHTPIIDKALWDKVQAMLSKNRNQHYLRTNTKEPSLLAGLLFDEAGHPLSPTHTRKKSRRYRYYVNQAVVQFKQTSPDALIRVPAQTLETLVEQELIKLLKAPGRLIKFLSPIGLSVAEQAALLQQASALSEKWGSLRIHQKIERLSPMVDKITLSRAELRLHFSSAGLVQVLLSQDKKQDDEALNERFVVRVPVALKRCGVETKLIVEQVSPQETLKPHADSRRAIQEALQKALLWNNALISGAAKSSGELAEQGGVSQRYVAQLIKLAYLSPAITNRIFKGNIPHDLTLGKLKRHIPLNWAEQEALFA